jgi:hypothetical protein
MLINTGKRLTKQTCSLDRTFLNLGEAPFRLSWRRQQARRQSKAPDAFNLKSISFAPSLTLELSRCRFTFNSFPDPYHKCLKALVFSTPHLEWKLICPLLPVDFSSRHHFSSTASMLQLGPESAFLPCFLPTLPSKRSCSYSKVDNLEAVTTSQPLMGALYLQ